MANMDNLIEAVAAGGNGAVYWGRVYTVDELTGKKTWSRRKYTVTSVNAATREATVRVNETGDTATIGEAKFRLLYKKAPRLPDESAGG